MDTYTGFGLCTAVSGCERASAALAPPDGAAAAFSAQMAQPAAAEAPGQFLNGAPASDGVQLAAPVADIAGRIGDPLLSLRNALDAEVAAGPASSMAEVSQRALRWAVISGDVVQKQMLTSVTTQVIGQANSGLKTLLTQQS
jgi:hypothetical protein